MNTFSIEGSPNSARVAEFDGAAPFAEFYLGGGGGGGLRQIFFNLYI